MYKMFMQRWREMEESIVLERADGETTFLENDVFHKFFVSPELLIGFYIWRVGYTENDKYDFSEAYDLFMEEYNGWSEDCKEIAEKAKEIFEIKLSAA